MDLQFIYYIYIQGERNKIKKELTLVEETTVNRYKTALEQCWEVSTDNSISEDNKVKIIRDVSRATLDGETTTADEYNLDSDEEDVQLAYSIVRSNKEVEGVFMQEGEITQIDYVDNTQEEHVRISDINKEIARDWKKEKK